MAQNIDLSIFDNPINGRVWHVDCARRDLLLARIRTEGNAVGHVSLLRNMVNDLQECSRLARVVKCQQPIKVPPWESTARDGWQGLELPKEALSSKRGTKSNWRPYIELETQHWTSGLSSC
uniref:Transposase n=1 Tax=Globodera pallida TaxID=36090 RepID=A0A183C070_GLOPA